MKKLVSLLIAIFMLFGLFAYTFAEGLSVQLKIGDVNAKVNGVNKKLDTAPFISGSERTLVPLRFIAEAFNADVKWVDKTQHIILNLNNIIKYVDYGPTPPIHWILKIGRAAADNEFNARGLRRDYYYSTHSSPATSPKVPESTAATPIPPPGSNITITLPPVSAKEDKEEIKEGDLPFFSVMEIDQAPVLVNNRTMVPLRFITETMMQLKVNWSDRTKTITITN